MWCLSQTICVCPRQSGSGTDSLCLLQPLFLDDLGWHHDLVIYHFCNNLSLILSLSLTAVATLWTPCPYHPPLASLIHLLLPRQGLTSKEMAKLGGRESTSKEMATLAGREKKRKRAKSLLRNPFSALPLR